MKLPSTWCSLLQSEVTKPYFRELEEFLVIQRAEHEVFPPDERVFTALEMTPFDAVRVVILGQDPYHDVGQAHGLSFSVLPGVKLPGSLRNIFRELHDDLGCPTPSHGCLEGWARQGVLLLNTVLTVRAHEANSHRGRGWEAFTDAIVDALNERERLIVFVLWGNHAQAKGRLIDEARHAMIKSAHPSPLSARNGFFGSKPFSRINGILESWGTPPIDWAIS